MGKEAYELNDATTTDDTRDGGKEQSSDDSKEVLI